MPRPCIWLVISALFAWGCVSDRRDCAGPDFIVLLRLSNRPLAADTVVHVTYGGSGTEDYVLSRPDDDHEVVFCNAVSPDGGATLDPASTTEAGATSDDDGRVDALLCQLWTGGFATLTVSSSGLEPTSYDLAPLEDQCTVTETLVLDSPDGG